jgi:N-methylhydantoinase A/oxoprolinase/acetone carboxylase beta subunit
MQILALTGSTDNLSLTAPEEKILTMLESRPYSIDELIKQTGVLFEKSLRLDRLENSFIIQRCGLTLTDILHVTKQFDRWSKESVENYCKLISRLTKMDIADMAQLLLDMGIERLTLELLKRQLDEETDPEALHACPVCQTLIKNLLSGGTDQYAVHIDLKRPVVGIGAPIHFFLPKATEALGAKAILPQDADVANAIGAITSNVVVRRHVRIIPNQDGGFLIEGLAGAKHFQKFEEADIFAREEVARLVRDLAWSAGTSSRVVELKTEDQIPTTADGKEIFMGRIIRAKLTGQPDIVAGNDHQRLAAAAN